MLTSALTKKSVLNKASKIRAIPPSTLEDTTVPASAGKFVSIRGKGKFSVSHLQIASPALLKTE